MFTSSSHTSLFSSKTPWEALINLTTYFKTLSLGVQKGTISPNATLINPDLITIGEGTTVAPGALIEGPCYIGKNCHIGHTAYLRPYTLLEDNCTVGHATEIKHSIFLSGAKAPHFNYVGDTILGANVNLGAGVKCSNVRVDHKPISVFFDGTWHNTGIKKLGALIGDRVQLGCNTVTNPGVIIYPDYMCGPNKTLTPSQTYGSRTLQKT
ncbi:MAG: UDP-N-acetylglucosamine diphosphorylase, partial [Simkaniaceae bacterium]|nr:UDP-N-acetylglucosamine diphosphorylase [Simkaniaceae bacterium]